MGFDAPVSRLCIEPIQDRATDVGGIGCDRADFGDLKRVTVDGAQRGRGPIGHTGVEVAVRRHQATCGPIPQSRADERRDRTARVDRLGVVHHPDRQVDVPCGPGQRAKVG